MSEEIMSKELFEKFGEAIDTLESVAFGCKDRIQKIYIESLCKQLSTTYEEIKEAQK